MSNIHKLYSKFAADLGVIVGGRLPKFWAFVITHEDGAGCGVYPNAEDAYEAAHKLIDEYATNDPKSYPPEEVADMKEILALGGSLEIGDINGSKFYIFEGRIGQVEMSK